VVPVRKLPLLSTASQATTVRIALTASSMQV
jgi:hypothetical protein